MNYNIIIEKLKSKHIVTKHLLAELQDKYPDERGFTQNGFKYSIDNETLKIKTLEIVSKHIGVPMSFWFTEDTNMLPADSAFETRIKQLEKERDYLQKYTDRLEKDLAQYEHKERKSG